MNHVDRINTRCANENPTTLDPDVQTYVEILLCWGEPPNLMSLEFQTWSNEVHRWMMDRGIGDDAIARKDVVDHYIVWLAWQDMKKRGELDRAVHNARYSVLVEVARAKEGLR